MNLYLISWSDGSYNSYDGAIVCAESEEDAKRIHPSGREFGTNFSGEWAVRIRDVSVKLIGKAVPGAQRGVELASFNAG